MQNTFDETYLRKLVADEVQGDFSPFNKNSIDKVRRYIKGMLGRLSDERSIIVEADYKSYGSGFASYIPVKISKKDKSDITTTPRAKGTSEEHDGLLLYICLLAPYWYYGKGHWWNNYNSQYVSNSGGGSMLVPEDAHRYNAQLWDKHIGDITTLFDEYRYRLLREKEVSATLPFKVDITTNLGNPPYTVFDCFFHWED